MNSDPRDKRSDPDFDPDFAAIHSAWSELEQVEPPQLLDQAVLNTARRQLDRSRKRRSLHWLGGFATAAVVVLALAIVVRQDPLGPAPPIPGTDGFRLERELTAPQKTEEDREVFRNGSSAAKLQMKRMTPAAPVAANEAPQLLNEEPPERSLEALDPDVSLPGPEAWVERMWVLRETGRMEEFAVELEAFRRAWPDYPLPPGLLD